MSKADSSDWRRRWQPSWQELPHGERCIILYLLIRSDDRGHSVATIDEIAGFWNWDSRTANRHMNKLVKGKARWFWRSPTNSDDKKGGMQAYRYSLDLERIGSPLNLAYQSDGTGAVWIPKGESRFEELRIDSEALKTPRIFVDAVERQNVDSTDQTDDLIDLDSLLNYSPSRAPARAGVSFPLPSVFHEFKWKSENHKWKAEQVLKHCGPDTGSLDGQRQRLLKSLARVLDGPWDRFDLILDVFPVVAHKTRGRSPETRLWDFGLLTENIAAHRKRRIRNGRWEHPDGY